MEEANSNEATPQPAQRVTQNVAGQQAARFVSKIKDLEQQVGEHVVAALQHKNTVAVITTIVIGPSGDQHIVSAAIDPSRMAQINALLYAAEQERQDDEICLGFHCLLRPKNE